MLRGRRRGKVCSALLLLVLAAWSEHAPTSIRVVRAHELGCDAEARVRCPKDEYSDGACGPTADCKPCPPFSSTATSGATSVSQCACDEGYYDSEDVSAEALCLPCNSGCAPGFFLSGACSGSADYDCKACRTSESCGADQYLDGECGGHYDSTCAACPAHGVSPDNATEASQCTCATGFFDADTAAQGVSCKPCRRSCGDNEYVSRQCGAVNAYAGNDAACSACPAHSALAADRRRLFGVGGRTPPKIHDCICKHGFFDDHLAQEQVNCVEVPARFGANYAVSKCQFEQFGLGRTARIDFSDKASDSAMLGNMVKFLHGVSADLLFTADFSDLCGQIFTKYHGEHTICGASFPLFAKGETTAAHINFLGHVTIKCHGFVDASAALQMCVQPCMVELGAGAGGCCWMPTKIAQWFGCCDALGCCATASPTPVPTVAGCVDQHPTCAALKQQLDQQGKDCFTDDIGKLTGNPGQSGKVLADECCATCAGARPTAPQGHCAKCTADGHTLAECTAIGVCRCSYSAACLRCLYFDASFTVAQCASYGIDCAQDCTHSGAPRRALRRGGAGTQVPSDKASAARFTALMDCLAKGTALAGCTTH